VYKFLIFTFVLVFFSQFTHAENTVNSFEQSTGFNNLTNRRYTMKPVGPVRELLRDLLTADQQRVADQAAQLAQNSSLLSVVLVERGKIIYEHYNYPARADRWQMSWSISKSLTAYTLGTAMCKGRFTNLDQPAAALSPELKGTVYAEATVRDVLKMSSGAPKAVRAGEAVEGGQAPDRLCRRRRDQFRARGLTAAD
jgi:CubicO group peptidase (beta-lactamase class C family)